MKKQFKKFQIGLAFAACFFIGISCNSNSSSASSSDADSSTATVPTEAPGASSTATTNDQKFTDPQIASIAVTANQIDIDYANIALDKSKNNDVREFAKTMAKDHQSVIDQAVALAKKLGVTPEDNPTTQSLLDGEKKVKEDFSSKSGADFDKAYVNNEVEYHKAAISLVESRLIPEATNPELKSLLQSALPLFKTHLEHAEMVQKDLNK